MTLPTIYARYEPITDAVARQYAPQQRWADLVTYHDVAATQPYARRMLVTPARSGQTPTLTLNGFRWPVQWLPSLEQTNKNVSDGAILPPSDTFTGGRS